MLLSSPRVYNEIYQIAIKSNKLSYQLIPKEDYYKIEPINPVSDV